ncbi:Mu transposase C-terminal domain-containing protein [Burkholderia cenocepacia]|uniref:Mu transposase C-terminal domain-containing protein n=1 Tax=Burkholderia cenocepacia TaxID=95486 RepID=UPI000B0ABE17|nr:Mu transposase C-terminal domain-containing protein [Burkholderia cenocepacia]
MNGFSLTKGQVFKLDGAFFRIERVLESGSITIEDHETSEWRVTTKQELLDAYAEGRIVAAAKVDGRGPTDEIGSRYGRPFAELAKQLQIAALRRKAYVDILTSEGRPAYTPRTIQPHILRAAKILKDERPPSPATVYRWCRAIATSNDPRTLIPRHDLRGPRKPRTDQRVIALFMESVAEESEISPRWSIKNAAARLERKLAQENHFLPEEAHLKLPNLRTLYRLMDRVDEYDITLLSEGKAAADRRFRMVNRGVRVSQVLERVEIDHTPLDIFLIDEITGLPCGRPTLTMLIDVYSRMPLGYYIGFDDTSTLAVMRALRHALLPKTPVKAVIPNVTVKNEWPCYGRFALLVCDNGAEFHSDSLAAACFDLRIQLMFCPSRQPRFKGVIERFLKTCNYGFAHTLPGTSLAHFTERGDYDSVKNAILTISEFNHLFEKWLLDVYAETTHRGIKTTPLKKWFEGVVGVSQKLPPSAEDIAVRLGVEVVRSLRHDGVQLHGLTYACDALLPIIRTYGLGIRVRIAFDPENLAAIWLWAPGEQERIRVPAILTEYTEGLRLVQHRMIMKVCRESEENGKSRKTLMEARLEIATAVAALASSKSLRKRRKAAKATGVSNENPLGSSMPSANKSRPRNKSRLRVSSQQPSRKLARIQRKII